MPTNRLKRLFAPDVLVTAAFVTFTYLMLAVKNGFMLRWYDEMSLFEPTWIYFRKFLYYPGGLLRYAGAWLTQLMYHPWLGAAVLVALWLLVAWLTRKAFSLSKAMQPLSFVVPMALFVSVVQLDEAWLSLKSTGYVYFNTLGYLFSVAGVYVYTKISEKAWIRFHYMAALVCCYAVAGFYALLSALMCVVLDAVYGIRGRRWTRCVESVAAVALGVLVPQMYYLCLPGNTVDNDFLYLKGLPELHMEGYDLYLWIPLALAAAVLMALTFIKAFGVQSEGRGWSICSLGVLLLCVPYALKAEKKSEQFRATVLMTQCIDRGEWNRVADILSLTREEHTYTMGELGNLAYGKLGKPTWDLSGMRPAGADARHSEKFAATVFLNVVANHHMGKYNESYRWAMEHTVQYGKRVFFLKYMVRNALLNGEPKLAKRYNDILLGTMFHRQWAEEMEPYINDPSMLESSPL